MNTSLLRYAVTYAACGSAQKAAERLGVSRSSVTRNIKRLEEELGAPLFIAAPDGVVPTYTGDICLRYARPLLGAGHPDPAKTAPPPIRLRCGGAPGSGMAER